MESITNAGEIYADIVEDGREELGRASAGLAFSAFSAGLNISFGAVALAVIGSITGGTGLLAMAAYPVGFLIVVLGQQELFTENTVTPVAVALKDRGQTKNTLRLWVVLFVFNMIGATAFAFVLLYAGILSPTALDLLLEEVTRKIEPGFWAVTLKGIFGGWLVA